MNTEKRVIYRTFVLPYVKEENVNNGLNTDPN